MTTWTKRTESTSTVEYLATEILDYLMTEDNDYLITNQSVIWTKRTPNTTNWIK